MASISCSFSLTSALALSRRCCALSRRCCASATSCCSSLCFGCNSSCLRCLITEFFLCLPVRLSHLVLPHSNEPGSLDNCLRCQTGVNSCLVLLQLLKALLTLLQFCIGLVLISLCLS